MRRARVTTALAAAIGVALLLGTGPPASAVERSIHSGVLVPPAQKVDGMTGGEMLGQHWVYNYTLPVPENPLAGHFTCLPLGRTGQVMWVAGPITCTAPAGTKLQVYGASSACSNVEPPPFYGADEAAQRQCAAAADERNASIQVSIDGSPTIELLSPQFEVFTPQLHVQLPPNNILEIDAQPATLTAHGWVAELIGLQPGLHRVHTLRTFSDGSTRVFDYALHITAGGGGSE